MYVHLKLWFPLINKNNYFSIDWDTYKICVCAIRVKCKGNYKTHCIPCPNADGRNVQSKEDDTKAVWKVSCPTAVTKTLQSLLKISATCKHLLFVCNNYIGEAEDL